MTFFKEHTMAKLDKFLQYSEPRIFEVFLEWFECKILDLATNLLQWFDVVYSQKDKVCSTREVANSWESFS
jgi:hypothetical protein